MWTNLWRSIFIVVSTTTFWTCVTFKRGYIDYGTNKTSDAIRLRGYYFRNYTDTNGRKVIHPIFLFEEGMVVVFPLFSSIYRYENGILKLDPQHNTWEDAHWEFQDFLSSSKKYYTCGWGLFRVTKDSIKIQIACEISMGEPFPRFYDFYEYKGIIINDTTFSIQPVETNYYGLKGIYHFRKYSPKPDSSNWLLKKKWFNK